MYFTHALNSALLGWLDLMVKTLYFVFIGFEYFGYSILKVMPWRKKLLEKRLKESKDSSDNTTK